MGANDEAMLQQKLQLSKPKFIEKDIVNHDWDVFKRENNRYFIKHNINTHSPLYHCFKNAMIANKGDTNSLQKLNKCESIPTQISYYQLPYNTQEAEKHPWIHYEPQQFTDMNYQLKAKQRMLYLYLPTDQ